MRSLLIALVLSVVASTALAALSEKDGDASTRSIERGLDFLAKDALAWKAKHQCASCHHAALVAWSMQEAIQRRFAVDETVMAEMTRWLAQSGDGKTGVPRPPGIPKALNAKAVWFALGLNANPKPDPVEREGLTRLLSTVRGDQLDNGGWAAWPGSRPPILGASDDSMTVLATLALHPAASSGDEASKVARDKGVAWLEQNKVDGELESLAMRLVLWKRLGRTGRELKPLILQLRDKQKPDGGWSQTTSMASDAWATGQALYALSEAGIKADDRRVRKGREFLLKTQCGDGSWAMLTRPSKEGEYDVKGGVAITGGAAAWAVLGLVRTQ